jgi:hypothetical protein
VSFQQRLHPSHQASHGLILAGHDAGEIKGGLFDDHSEDWGLIHQLEHLDTSHQRLGGDAAAVQAGAADAILLHQGCFAPQLSGADGSNVPPRPPANDDNIIFVWLGHLFLLTDEWIPQGLL